MEAINDYLAGVVRLYHTNEDTNNLQNIIAIDVCRKCANAYSPDADWVLAGTKSVVTNDDKDFVFVDYSTRHGETYIYKTVINVLESGTSVPYDGKECTVESKACGIVIGVGEEYFTLNFNANYTTQRTYNMTYIQPYHSKYPHAVRNGDADYNSGTVSGYFNEFDNNCSIDSKAGYFSEAIENFLTDGRIKTLKTYDGYVWRVMVDNPVKREKTNSRDYVFFSFNWHAVADPVPAGYFVQGG